MIKLTIINILGQPNGILNLKKGYDKTLKHIYTVREDLRRICFEVYEICNGYQSNNLRLNEISILTFFSKINSK